MLFLIFKYIPTFKWILGISEENLLTPHGCFDWNDLCVLDSSENLHECGPTVYQILQRLCDSQFRKLCFFLTTYSTMAVLWLEKVISQRKAAFNLVMKLRLKNLGKWYGQSAKIYYKDKRQNSAVITQDLPGMARDSEVTLAVFDPDKQLADSLNYYFF